MGYMSIGNLYNTRDILLFRDCFVSEKIDGTSAHIQFMNGELKFYEGGGSYYTFVSLFDRENLLNAIPKAFEVVRDIPITIYGEFYGGKIQAQSKMYGKESKFVAFDIQIGELFLNMDVAAHFSKELGLDFVWYTKVEDFTIEKLDAFRVMPSMQSQKLGIPGEHRMEGIIIRPIVEMRKNNGVRVIAKYKNEEFRERRNEPKVMDPEVKVRIESESRMAEEWVVPERIKHALSKLFPVDYNPAMSDVQQIGLWIVEDVLRESKGEVQDTKSMRNRLFNEAAKVFKKMLAESLH